MTAHDDPKKAPVDVAADTIRARISSGVLLPGAKLPSTKNLAKEFGISESLVHRVVSLLKESGHVIGRQGAGVFVREYRPLYWDPSEFERGERRDNPETGADDWEAQVAAQSRVPHQNDPAISVEPASAEVSTWLQIEPGDTVVVRRRLRSVDGEPAQIADSFFPLEVAQGTALMEPRRIAMRKGALAAAGKPQRFLRDEMTPRTPTPDEIERLRLPKGTVVTQHVRIGYDANRKPLRVMVTIAPGDRNVIVYEMEVDA